MAKVESSYVIADKRFRQYRKHFFTDTWASAGQVANWELSALPAGEYLDEVVFSIEGTVRQDGNGSDAISGIELLNVLEMVTISNGSNVHLRAPLYIVAQDTKLFSGSNPYVPDSIGASSVGSNVDTDFSVIVNFLYGNPFSKRFNDTSYPTSLIQDGNLEIRWNSDVTVTGHASNALQNATCRILMTTSRLNRATIPPEVEVGYIQNSSDSFNLPKGAYHQVWLTGFTKTNKLTQTSISVDADGMPLIAAGLRLDELEAWAGYDVEWYDDDTQVPIQGDTLDRNFPPTPLDSEDLAYHWLPVIYGCYEGKMSKLPRVEHSLNFDLTTTGAIAKHICYRRYKSHTSSGLDARAKIMGFGPGSSAVPRTNRRSLNRGDMSLANLLPVRLVQSPPV